MTRLSALDANFLYAETPESPMHVAGLAIFEPPPRGVNAFERFRDHIAERLHALPFFLRRLNAMPVALDNPVWVREKSIDLDYHIRHLALPAPGTMEQLRTLVARLHMILLDRSRPLWQYYVIEGLEGGGFAAYIKMHHAGIDGGAGMAAVEVIFGTSKQSTHAAPSQHDSAADQDPNFLEMLSNSYMAFWRQQTEMLKAWPELGKTLAAVGRRAREDAARLPDLLTVAPKTLFNATLSNQRSFGTSTISLSEVKELGKAHNAKINDVVMAVCAGALRRYLADRNALPKEPLVAGVPVSLREPGNTQMNNQVTMMLCSLATDVKGPIERLAKIVDSSRDSKARLGDVKDVLPKDISFFGAPIVLTGLAQLASRTRAADQLPALANVVISNVPGPRKLMYCAGATMRGYFPVSIPANGNALNITVQSYLDNLDFGLISCRSAVPDAQVLADLLVEEFEAMKHAKHDAPQEGIRTIDIAKTRTGERSAAGKRSATSKARSA